MEYKFSFERLEVWQLARMFNKFVYSLTEDFPKSEIYGLTSQLRRASVSVASNIAEGSARTSKKDQAHFYQFAYSSLMEVANQMILAKDLNYIESVDLKKAKANIAEISNKLNALRKSCIR